MNYLFLPNGYYASVVGRIEIPTDHFTEPMWEAIRNATDDARIGLASHFNVGIHTYANGVCKVCGLGSEDVPRQQVSKPKTKVTNEDGDDLTPAD